MVGSLRPATAVWTRALHPNHPFAQGLLCDVSNPKVFVFFLTFLPQFLSPGQPSMPVALALATIAAAVDVTWLSLYAMLLGRIAPLVRRSSVQRWLDRIIGMICIAFGIHLVVERQT